MFRKEVEIRPLLLWLLCAMSAPAAQLLGGQDWRWLIVLGGVCTAIACVSMAGTAEYGKILSGIQATWLIVALAVCGQFAGEVWPMGNTQRIVPLVLLLLAAWSASKGTAAAARTAGILFIILCVGYGLILAAGIAQANWSWIATPQQVDIDKVLLVSFVPGAAACLPRKRTGGRAAWLLVIPTFALAVTVATCGSVHPEARVENYPFFEMCRSLSLFGFAERFEALICAALTVGWFSFMALLFTCFGACWQKMIPGKTGIGLGIAVIAAATLFLGKMSIPSGLLSLVVAVFWGVIPLCTQVLASRKKDGKK